MSSLLWRHNGRDGVSNHQPHDCLLNRLFRRGSKKTSKLRVTGLCAWNSPGNSPHKWSVTRKILPFDDVIMLPSDLLKSRSRQIGCHSDCIALKFDRHLGNTVVEVRVKFKRRLETSKPESRGFTISYGKTSTRFMHSVPAWYTYRTGT